MSQSGGCHTCRVTLSGNQVRDAMGKFQETGRTCVPTQRFLVIDFEDGFDALFVRASESDSGTDAQATLAAVAAEWACAARNVRGAR